MRAVRERAGVAWREAGRAPQGGDVSSDASMCERVTVRDAWRRRVPDKGPQVGGSRAREASVWSTEHSPGRGQSVVSHVATRALKEAALGWTGLCRKPLQYFKRSDLLLIFF